MELQMQIQNPMESRNVHPNNNKKGIQKRSREPLRNITNGSQDLDGRHNLMEDGPPVKKARISKSEDDQPLKLNVITQPQQNSNSNSITTSRSQSSQPVLSHGNDEDHDQNMQDCNENDEQEPVINEESNECQGGIEKWDQDDINNELMAIIYINDIMKVLRLAEKTHAITNDYMSLQTDINSRMRKILLDWLVEVHRKFQLLPQTFYLCVNLLDRFLSKTQVHRSRLQLTGCACLWISCKYHEIYAPEIQDFVYISDKAFTREDLVRTEVDVVEKLDFNLTVATPLSFAERFNKIGVHHLQNDKEKTDVNNLCLYLIEHCLMDYELAREAPSKIASSCLAYALLGTRLLTAWPGYLIRETAYELKDLISIIEKIDVIVKNPKCKHRAIRKKYSQSKYSRVALLNFDKLNTRVFYSQLN